MATLLSIPLNEQLPWYAFNIVLSGATYTLEVRYNTRKARWLMNIRDVTEAPLLMGVPLLIERDLTTQYTYLKIPPGTFVALDNSGQGLQPTLTSFLVDHTLYYVDPTP